MDNSPGVHGGLHTDASAAPEAPTPPGTCAAPQMSLARRLTSGWSGSSLRTGHPSPIRCRICDAIRAAGSPAAGAKLQPDIVGPCQCASSSSGGRHARLSCHSIDAQTALQRSVSSTRSGSRQPAAPFGGGGRGFSAPAGQSAAPEGPPAFVFDIDGVLIRGGTVLPEARRALARLYTPGGACQAPCQAAMIPWIPRLNYPRHQHDAHRPSAGNRKCTVENTVCSIMPQNFVNICACSADGSGCRCSRDSRCWHLLAVSGPELGWTAPCQSVSIVVSPHEHTGVLSR